MGPDRVERVINTLRDITPNAIERFTNGDCFKLYRLLHACFPEAMPYYDFIEGHVYTCIDGNYYDIRGKCLKLPKTTLPMTDEKRIFKEGFRWAYVPQQT